MELLNEILDFAKGESGKLRLEHVEFDLRRPVEEVVELFQLAAQSKGLGLSHKVMDAVPKTVNGDPGRLRQVLANLVGNAVKFTEQGSVALTVELAEQVEQRVMVRFIIQDTGIGLPPGVQEKIFEAFVQADGSTTRKFGGTGLGLAICKQIVDQCGGKIGVQSIEGQGATFWFTMPLVTGDESCRMDSTVRTLPSRDIDIPLPTFCGRVLLAEDNLIIQQVAQEMLKAFGCIVEMVSDGGAAVRANAVGDYDLILMDWHMPTMDGVEATKAIRSQEEMAASSPEGNGSAPFHIPIIALTASALCSDREACLSAGMDDYLSKPFTIEQLGDVLSRWLKTKPMKDATQGELTVAMLGAESGPTMPPQVTAHPTSVPCGTPVDLAVLESLRTLRKNDGPALLRRLIETYLEHAPAMLDALRRSANGHDAEGIRRAAHRMKSSSANLGAIPLSALCKELETLGRSGSVQNAGQLVDRVEEEHQRVCTVLEQRMGDLYY